MKKFSFSLQTVLELKRHREEALLEELGRRQRAAAEAEAALAAMREKRRRAQRELRELLTGPLAVERVQEARDYLSGLDVELGRRAEQARARQEEVRECRQRVVAAARERKVLERLRDRQWEDYLQEFSRQEQAFLDELATQGYARQEQGV
ncbi:MAG: flagellar export protein FliJ [Chitinophagales bacterium]